MKKGVNGSWDKISTHLTGTEFNFQFRTRHFDLLLICFGYFSKISPDGIDFQFGTDTFTFRVWIGAEGLLYEKDVHSPGYHYICFVHRICRVSLP